MLGLFVIALFYPLAAWALATGDRNPGPLQREYNLTITWEAYAPDGFSRQMLLVNGQSPGPIIEADQDDWIVVVVRNQSPYQTSVHFHGIEMKGTPWSDGVPGVTQRLIQPGRCFTYKFQATQYGSYWYHSHAHGQIEDGLYGPIVIRPSPDVPKPFGLISGDPEVVCGMEAAEQDVQPLMLYDYMHITSEQKWNITPHVGAEISCYDSLLFNGKGRVRCLPQDELALHLGTVQKADLDLVPGTTLTDKGCLPAIVMAAFGGDVTKYNGSALPAGIFEGCHETNGSTEVIHAKGTPSKSTWVAIDIIAAVNFVNGVLAIDDHDMWVYAMDGSYIEPQRVQALSISNGDRYSILIRPKQPGDFQIRLHATSAPQTIVGNAILHVPGKKPRNATQPKQYMDLIGRPLSSDVIFFNQTTAHPYPPEPVAQKADALHVLNMRLNGASYLWALNSTGLQLTVLDHTAPPILLHPESVTAQNNVTIRTQNDTWVDLVFLASVYPMPPHPIHKHGNKMFVIGSGTGPFRWKSVEEAMTEIRNQFNLVNPPRRDTVVSTPARDKLTWVAVRYHVSNPGAWMIHCHISNHMVGGMSMVILDGLDAWPKVPQEYVNYE